jgi:hypothetical protein
VDLQDGQRQAVNCLVHHCPGLEGCTWPVVNGVAVD